MTPTATGRGGPWALLLRNTDLVFTAGLFATVVLLVMPVRPVLMDLLLAMSIGVALLMLLLVIYVKDPPEFSVFPTLLLTVTLFRLGLNVASTRLILLDGYAGNVIDAFGNFVVRGNYVVGAVVFLILVIINFVVITKGSGRIAEVAARFTLDAMPGKQMAIDAELNAGSIDEATAARRREKIQKEADFYGSMDGASKFVRGDAIAGILITLINVVGGIAIGLFQKDLGLLDALQKYSLLSIGDGLVSQIPALVVSVAAGILITRSSENDDLGTFVGKQFTVYPRALAIAGAMLLAFAAIPGLPAAPFVGLGVLALVVARLVHKGGGDRRGGGVAPGGYGAAAGGAAGLPGEAAGAGSPASELPRPSGAPAAASPEDFAKLIQVETFSVEMGYGLLTLADREKGGDLLDRITGVRRSIARELGVIVPPIAVRDNFDLEANCYRFLVRNQEVAGGEIIPHRWMAMNVSGSTVTLKGVPAVEPVFGLEAVWITGEERKTAEINGYTVVDNASVLITHLSETLKENAHLVLEREDVQGLVDLVREKNPTLVAELLPDLVSIGLIQRVLQNLLRERVPVKNLGPILETVADTAPLTKNADDLTAQVRRRLGDYFVQDYESEPGVVQALTLEPGLEQHLVGRVKRGPLEVGLVMEPTTTGHLLNELTPRVEAMAEQGLTPVLVCSAELRLAFKRFFEPTFPRLAVLAYQEIPNRIQVKNFGLISAPLEAPVAPLPEAAPADAATPAGVA